MWSLSVPTINTFRVLGVLEALGYKGDVGARYGHMEVGAGWSHTVAGVCVGRFMIVLCKHCAKFGGDSRSEAFMVGGLVGLRFE